MSVSLAKSRSRSYIYAEDGTNPDGIDVYSVSGTTLTSIQHVAVGDASGTVFGANHLAVVTSPAHCLIFSSDGNEFVYSLSINTKTGMLGTTPVSSVAVGGYPQGLAVSGSTVVESNSNFYNSSPTIDVLSVGSGCALSLLSQNSTGSEDDFNIGLANATTVVSADINSGDQVAYKLDSGHLVETVKDFNSRQLANPDGIAVSGTNMYTGQNTFGVARAQGFTFNGGSFTPVKGSPQTATDSSAFTAIPLAVSAANQLLAQGDVFSGKIGWYSLAKKMAYRSDTPLALSDWPTVLTVLGSNLLVAQTLGGDLEACKLAPDKVSGCHTIATLTGAGSGHSGSVAVLTVKKKK